MAGKTTESLISRQTPSPEALRPDDARQLRRKLVRWYLAHQRTLPWRKEPANPYHVMVSEAMLQQTQVATVIAYFQRFIEAFPTVESLAQADEQQVLSQWQGLGYYRRARLLHAAAKTVVDEHEGHLPACGAQLLKLPGVGRYTAGAIASIAFGLPEPIVDGNVARVLARATALSHSIDEKTGQDTLWRLAGELVTLQGRGMGTHSQFNQAMMELGALVCTPAQPNCAACPWQKDCQARATDRVLQLPVRSEKRKPQPVVHHVMAVSGPQGYLLVQRPGKGLWSNMWQLPTLELPATENTKQQTSRTRGPQTPSGGAPVSWFRQACGLACDEPAELETFVHQTTHRTITFRLWRTTLRSDASGMKVACEQPFCWRRPGETGDLPMSNPQRRMLARLARMD